MDNNMLNILKNLDAAEKGETATGKPSPAATEKNAMKALLEGLDAQQNSVNQMPADHKMAKNGAKHPASKYLVGGEEGEPEADAEVVSEELVGAKQLRAVKVTFSNGDSINTDMAAGLTDEQIYDYYKVGRRFNLGDGAGGDNVVKVTDVEILEGLDEEDKDVDQGEVAIQAEDVIAVWKEVFPYSAAYAKKGALGGGMYFSFLLSAGRDEVSNGILENDPLNYRTLLDTDGTWSESATSMFIAPPEGSHLAFGSAKFRKKKAKNVTLDQLRKRFEQVKAFVTANADNMHQINFDINQKLGTTVQEGAAGDWGFPNWGDDAAPGIQVGDNVHIGHVQPGASGVEGRVIRIEGDVVFIKNAEGKTYKGQLKNTTVQEGTNDGQPVKSVDEKGNTSYKLDGKLHRLDGPAYINAGGYGRFYVHGKHVSQAEMEHHADQQVTAVTKVGEDTLSKREAPRQQMNKKQSFADIFKSMEEASEDKEFNMEKDFHNKIQKEKALTKGDNGKFNLTDAEDPKLNAKDAKTSQIIKKARSQYSGRADDDLSAVVAMMTDKDEQLDTYDHDQDSDIVRNDIVNNDQEANIADILQRLEKLEKGE